MRGFVDDAIYGNNSKLLHREQNVKSSHLEQSQSSSDLAEFVFYSDRKPGYLAGTKLRRKIYRQLKEEDFLLQQHVSEIVNDFVKDSSRENNKNSNNKINNLHHEVFTCKCGWLLYDPTTLPCGHTFCKHCVEENMFCAECGYTLTTSCNVSPLLVEVISSWFQTLYTSTGFKKQSKEFFSSNHFTEALNSINAALALVSEDFTALNLRVETFYNLQRYNAALQDAELSCKINDSCGKSHYVRALCHLALKNFDQAIDAFQHSIELASEDMIMINAIITSLGKVFAVDVCESEVDLKRILREIKSLDYADDDISCTSNNKDGTFDNEIRVSEDCSRKIEKGKVNTDEESSDDHSYVSKRSNPIVCCLNSIEKSAELPSGLQAASSESRRISNGVPDNLINEDVFECKLCYDLLFRPVTMTCGHVFCKSCLVKTLDYNALCPICRLELSDYQKDPMKPVTVVIENILQIYLKEQFTKRNAEYTAKMDRLSRVGIDDNVEHPIFTCSIAFPNVQCPLHIFEPKYRQMMRECLESGSCRFGMCSPQMDNGHSDFGTILIVTNYELLDDGRFIIHTVAGKRFVCKEKYMIDSLNYANVTYFEDDEVDSNSEEFSNTTRSAYDDLSSYVNNLKTFERDILFKALGELPPYEKDTNSYPDGLPWVWWGLAALPLNFTAKLALLRSKSVKERMKSLQRFLRFLAK